MRTLAIDYGLKRVGLALSDAGGTLASPLSVLQRSTDAALIQQIVKTIDYEGVDRVVLGVPLNMDGTAGPNAKAMAVLGREILVKAAPYNSRLSVVLVDERLSSFDAEQSLNDRKRAGERLTRKGKKQQLDAMAAAVFLQSFLDGNLIAIDPESLR